jgi:hypothetical protein
MLPSCLLLKIWYLQQQQCNKHKIGYSFHLQVHVQSHPIVVVVILSMTNCKVKKL